MEQKEMSEKDHFTRLSQSPLSPQ